MSVVCIYTDTTSECFVEFIQTDVYFSQISYQFIRLLSTFPNYWWKNVCGDEKDSEANQGDENTCHSKMAMVEVEMRCAKRGTTYVTSCPSKWKCGGIR